MTRDEFYKNRLYSLDREVLKAIKLGDKSKVKLLKAEHEKVSKDWRDGKPAIAFASESIHNQAVAMWTSGR